MVDTIQVHRHSEAGIIHLLEHQLGQPRDLKRNYKSLNAGDKLADAINSYKGPTPSELPSDKEIEAEKAARAAQDAESNKEELWTSTHLIFTVISDYFINFFNTYVSTFFTLLIVKINQSFDAKVLASVVHKDTLPASSNFSSYAVNNISKSD